MSDSVSDSRDYPGDTAVGNGRTPMRALRSILGSEWAWLAPWAVLLALPLALRGPLPPDEARYLSVAWDMWTRGDFLVPHLNGGTYADKPPVLFWLMHAGWAVFGVNDWWPRMLPSLAALVAMLTARSIARTLWPGTDRITSAVPWLLIGTLAWPLYTQAILFDLLLTDCTLIGLLGIVRAARGDARGWLIVAAASAVGLLTKGPATLLHLAGPGLLAFWWVEPDRFSAPRWYGRFLLAVLGGSLLAGVWALFAALGGGEAYARELLLGQTAGRLVNSFAHARSIWYYVWMLPLMVFPWSVWPAVWSGLRRGGAQLLAQRGTRLLLTGIVPAFLTFSLISGKQPHYLLPILPLVAMLIAWALEQRAVGQQTVSARVPIAATMLLAGILALLPLLPAGDELTIEPWSPAWGIGGALVILALARSGPWPAVVRRLALAMPVLIAASETAFFSANPTTYDVERPAAVIRSLVDAGHTVAYAGSYAGEFHFAGRLTDPLPVMEADDRLVTDWLNEHPDGLVVRELLEEPAAATFSQQLRGKWLVIQSAADLRLAAARGND